MMMMQQPMVMAPVMMPPPPVVMAYVSPTGYLPPAPQFMPPPTYPVPQPDVFISNAVWVGFYNQDGQDHPVTFKNFQARPNEVVRGKGKDDIGEFILQGYVEGNGVIRFEKQYLGKHTVHY